MARSMKRRCAAHDYHSRCAYMVTITKAPEVETFSTAVGDPLLGTTQCGVRYRPLGLLISRQLRQISVEYPEVRILQYIIMPDHVHIVIFITKDVDYNLGSVIGRFTGNCTRCNNMVSIFEEGYNDRIVRHEGQLDRMIRYVRDNPRRLLLRRLHPEFFSRRITLMIDGCPYQTYGNSMLLTHPILQQVRYSSEYSTEEIDSHRRKWFEAIRQGGVLVSPFIHPKERAVRDYGVGNGVALIYIVKEDFGEKYKPQGLLFALCT